MKRVQDGMDLSKRKFLRRVKGKAGTLADDDKGIEGDIGMGSHTLFCPHVVDVDGRSSVGVTDRKTFVRVGYTAKVEALGISASGALDRKTIQGG